MKKKMYPVEKPRYCGKHILNFSVEEIKAMGISTQNVDKSVDNLAISKQPDIQLIGKPATVKEKRLTQKILDFIFE